MPSIDRNERARLLFQAEALDRRTHQPGQHGGCLKRTGLAVFRALLFHFANAVTGRCDPGYDALARAAGVARSTVAVALGRLEAAGLLARIRRQLGTVRWSNAYVFPKSECRPQTTTLLKTTTPASAQTSVVPMAVVFTRVRAALRGDYERIVRARAARQARQMAG